MTGIVTAILGVVQHGDNNKRHRETVDAINSVAERQAEVFTEVVAAINGVVERRDEALIVALKDAMREVVREELAGTRSTVGPNGRG